MAAPEPILEDLLAPISEEHPAGEDITLAPEWQAINEARRRDKLLDRQNADWPLIRQLLSQALAHKSKDLRLAVWLTEANVKLYGFAGLRDSLQLLRGLIVNFWDLGLYPEIEGGDLQFRAMPLGWFGGDNLPRAVRQIPLTARTDGGRDYSYLDYRQSRAIGWEKDTRNSFGDIDSTKKEKRKVALAAGGVSAEMFEEAVQATHRAGLETTHTHFDEVWEELQRLDRILDEKFKPDVPGTTDTKEALEDCGRMLDDLLKRKRQEEPDPALPGEPVAPADRKAPRSQLVPLPAAFLSDGADIGGSWAQAEELVRKGSLQEGLAEMTRLASQQCGRVIFLHRLRLAEICLSTDRNRLAIAILEDLAKSIEELHLEKWEAPELLGRVWGRLHRCYREAEPGSEQAARAAAFLDRLCKLDPWQALRWDE
ncbi:MAG: type VI secretion system protein TssA [Bryobacteraceae bacterium]|jgi:type VI secretion system protein ImpA